VIDAIVFDLDGVLIRSEEVWNDVRRQFVAEVGGEWSDRAAVELMGSGPTVWPQYMHERLNVPLSPREIASEVLARLAAAYRRQLPLIEGAVAAVRGLAAHWPLGVASSSERELIDLVLDLSGLDGCFRVTVSTGEVAASKPGPEVYIEACRRLRVPPERAAAIEDSGVGLLAASAAGMRIIAIPNRSFPPAEEALARSDKVLDDIRELTPAVIEAL
jgi:HAD superfamily hydrolase (TIGR01509 family)